LQIGKWFIFGAKIAAFQNDGESGPSFFPHVNRSWVLKDLLRYGAAIAQNFGLKLSKMVAVVYDAKNG